MIISRQFSHIKVCTLIVVLITFLHCATFPHVESPLIEYTLQDFGSVSIEWLEERVEEGIERAPYRSDAMKVFKGAGFSIAAREDADFHVSLQTNTQVLPTVYDPFDNSAPFILYNKVISMGDLVIEVPGQEPMIVTFRSQNSPRMLGFRPEGEPSRADAPFRDAFEEPGGYYDALNHLLRSQLSEQRMNSLLDVDAERYQLSLIRYLENNDVRSSAPKMFALLKSNPNVYDEIFLVLARWGYEPALDYAIQLTEQSDDPIFLHNVFRAHEIFADKRSLPSIFEYIKKREMAEKDPSYQIEPWVLLALESITGESPGNTRSDWASWDN